jgi:ribosome biogenesis GTPase A
MVRVRYSFGSRHTGRITNIKKQRGKYPDVMKDVVRISDIVLEILDARYVEETRNLEVEADVLRQRKKLIFVLNKSDLVDEKDVKLPKDMRPFVFISATKGKGSRDLKGKIQMEAKRILKAFSEGTQKMGSSGKFSKIKDKERRDALAKAEKGKVVKSVRSERRVHVGVIGYPNAGKSSVINMITKRAAAKTAKQAGFTKGMQKIKMSEGILILDTPGVIPASEYSTEVGSFAKDVKVGGRTYSDVKDPEDVVFYLISPRDDSGDPSSPIPKDPNNVTKEEQAKIDEAARNAAAIAKFYDIKNDGVNEMIEELGNKKGFLGKGGKVDVDRTARIILRDWQLGEIK